MRRWDQEHHREALDHYVTSGRAVLTVGLVSLATAVGCMALDIELGFIDGPSMVLISAAMVGVGGWMARFGREA